MKKRVLALLLAATMVFGLTACGGSDTPATDNTQMHAVLVNIQRRFFIYFLFRFFSGMFTCQHQMISSFGHLTAKNYTFNPTIYIPHAGQW